MTEEDALELDGDDAAPGAGARSAGRAPDPLTQYAELTKPQPNTLRTEPGARTEDLTREGSQIAGMTGQGQREPTQAPSARGVYANKFTTEGARLHGSADGRDQPEGSRPGAWRPDETKSIGTGSGGNGGGG